MNNLQSRVAIAATSLTVFSVLPLASIQAEPMDVTATVLETCELNTIGDAAFPDLTPGSGDVATASTIGWRCTTGTSAEIEINDGLNGTRNMQEIGAGTDSIAYELYTDGALSDRWGLKAANEELGGLAGVGMTNYTDVTVHAEVLNGAYIDSTPGDYTDTVTVTINILP